MIQKSRYRGDPGSYRRRARSQIQKPGHLFCLSVYRAPADDYNLRTIPNVLWRLGLVTGLPAKPYKT